MSESVPYKEAFPEGTQVRVADRSFLEEFKDTWKYHHKLQPEQLGYADRVTTVEKMGNRFAAGHFSTSCSIACVSSAILGLSQKLRRFVNTSLPRWTMSCLFHNFHSCLSN
jgi:hypothetical protein